jgi:hypothetical protein
MNIILALLFLFSNFAPADTQYVSGQSEWLSLCQYVLDPLDLENINNETLIHIKRIKIGCLDRWDEDIQVPDRFTHVQNTLVRFHHDLWQAMYYLDMGLQGNGAAIDAARSYMALVEIDLADFDNEIEAVYLPQV